MKKLFSKIMKKSAKRRGFTVAEVAVALAVILIVSGAAITFIGSQTRVESQAVATIEATNIAENAIECFRYAQKNDKDFKGWFGHCGYTINGEGTQAHPYTVEKNGATVTITIDGDTIEITATMGNDTEILETVYTYPTTQQG